MAGLNAGAPSPIHSPQAAAQSRTRRYHGAFILARRDHSAFPLAGLPAVVTSSRRRGDRLGVALELDNGAAAICGEMTAAQARAMACALLQAADAACMPQDQRQPCSWGQAVDVPCPDCKRLGNTVGGAR